MSHQYPASWKYCAIWAGNQDTNTYGQWLKANACVVAVVGGLFLVKVIIK